MEHLLKAFGIVYFSVYLIVISIVSGMILIGFKEKTAIEHTVYKPTRPISSDILKASSALDLSEGEEVLLTYTSAVDKIKFFSAFIREGLESGDAVWYTYPDEESETVRAKLKEHGIDAKKHEKDGTLRMETMTEGFMSNGKLDFEKGIIDSLNWWAEMKRKGYKHARGIEDFGDFSVFNGQWQRYVTEYWLDPRWDDPNISEWVESREPLGVVYVPFLKEVTAINVERMTEAQVVELLKAMGEGTIVPARSVDLLENVDSFSRLMDLNHEKLVGREILLEFDPTSDYEKVVDSLAKESMANVEPLFVFTPSTSPIRKHFTEHSAIKFFLMSLSTSTPKSTSKNTLLLPAKNTPLILDATNKVLETYADANVCFVFDILSELLPTIGREKTFNFLRRALDLLSSEKVSSLFLLNTSAHDPEVVSRLRSLFSNQLVYDKNGMEVVKTF